VFFGQLPQHTDGTELASCHDYFILRACLRAFGAYLSQILAPRRCWSCQGFFSPVQCSRYADSSLELRAGHKIEGKHKDLTP
jgi:hypothetical protein